MTFQNRRLLFKCARWSILRFNWHITAFQMLFVYIVSLFFLVLCIQVLLAKAEERKEGGLESENKGSLEILCFISKPDFWIQGYGEIDFTVDDAGQITSNGGVIKSEEISGNCVCKTNYIIEVNNLHGQVIEGELKPPLGPESFSEFLSKLKAQIYLSGMYGPHLWTCQNCDDFTDPPLPWGPFNLTLPFEYGATAERTMCFEFVIHPPKCFVPPILRRKLPRTIGCSSQCIEYKKKQYEGTTHKVFMPDPSTGTEYVWHDKSVNLYSGYRFGDLTFWGSHTHKGIIVSYKSPVVGVDCVKGLSTGEFREMIHRRALQDKNLMDKLKRLHR